MGRELRSSGRWQRAGVGAAAAIAVLRVIFDGYLWSTAVLLIVGRVLGMFFIVFAAPRTRSEFAEGRELRDAWKALSGADRRAVRRAVRERESLRPDLVMPGEVFARARARNGERLPWTCIGFVALTTSSPWDPWSLLVVALALSLGVVLVLRGTRWRRDCLAVVGQQSAAAE